MRIIDSNRDFYDFYQNVYMDPSITFDRRDSYDLTYEEFADYFAYHSGRKKFWYEECDYQKTQSVLLQVCNTFWLFDLTITKTDNFGQCKEYELRLVQMWKDYSKHPVLISLSHIMFAYPINNAKQRAENMVEAVKTNDYKTVDVFNEFLIIRSNKNRSDHIIKHIPILKNIGVAKYIDPLDIFLSFEEYFSTHITKSERTESIGLTDVEKITNHGFDAKTSFRGKTT